jgi:hypothetical protein
MTLQDAVVQLKKKSPYGELTDWEKVKTLLPIGGKATLTDLDTKRKFLVQRIGGFNHADIEPLTSIDSATVQALFSSRWSWKRRAVVLDIGDGKKIAGSLVGMPQGKDQLKDNDCNGNLGLFFNSPEVKKSHNLSHQVLIWKAAGKTNELLKGLSPEETILVLFTALDQSDWATLQRVVKPFQAEDRRQVQEIIGATVSGIRKRGQLNFQIAVSLSLQKGPYNHHRYVMVKLARDKEMKSFYTNRDFIGRLLK